MKLLSFAIFGRMQNYKTTERLHFLNLLHANPIYSWEMQGGPDSAPPA